MTIPTTDPRVMAGSLLQTSNGRSTSNSVVDEAKALPPEKQLQMLMSSSSWRLFQGFLQWACVWDNTQRGERTEFNDDSRAVMLAPFTLFGADPYTASVYWEKCIPAFMREYGQWRGDELYAKANTMPWLVVQAFAPTLAFEDKGPDAQVMAWKLIAELKEHATLPFIGPDSRGDQEQHQQHVQEQQTGARGANRAPVQIPRNGNSGVLGTGRTGR